MRCDCAVQSLGPNKVGPSPEGEFCYAPRSRHTRRLSSAPTHPGRHQLLRGCKPTMVRREANEGDPFVNVLFKLRVNEKELLDEWVAQTTLTRSGFVTELLVLELGRRT